MFALSKSTVVLQQSLNPDMWERIAGKLSSIPGFDQSLPEREIVHIYLPARILHVLGESKLLEILQENQLSFRWHSSRRMIFKFGIRGADVNDQLLNDLWRAVDGLSNFTTELSQVVFAKPPGADALLQFHIALSLSADSMVVANVRTGYLDGRNPPKDGQKVADHQAFTGEVLRKVYSRIGLSVADVSAEGAFFKSASGNAEPILESWSRLRRAEWLSSMAGETVQVLLSMGIPESEVEVDESLSNLRRTVAAFEGLPWLFDGRVHLKWKGFPEIDARWLDLGRFVMRFDPGDGPVELPIGFIRTGEGSMNRVPLNLYWEGGVGLLVAKGGGAKMAKMLSEHFEVPWLQGTSPIAFSGKLEGSAPPEFPQTKPPQEFYKVPEFFKKAGVRAVIACREFRVQIEDANYLEEYPAEKVEGALHDLVESFDPDKSKNQQLASSLVRWEEPADWDEAIDGVLLELRDASYGLFVPVDIRVEFEGGTEGDGGPPESGSEVRISFEFGGERHEMGGEFFHGSVPYELMPFVQKVMEECCNGVAFRPIFGEGPEFALCTSGALERLKKSFGLLE